MKPIKIVILFVAFFSFGFIENGEAKEKREPKPAPEFPFKRFYVDVSFGYHFRIGIPERNGTLQYVSIYPGTGMLFAPVGAAVGKGLSVGSNFGFKFNRYIGLEIGGGYITYPEMIVSNFGTAGTTVQPGYPPAGIKDVFYPYTAYLSLDTRRGWISFQTILMPGFARYNPYVKFGISILAGDLHYSTRLHVYNSEEPNFWDHKIVSANYAGKNTFCMVGFTGALGIDCRINTWLSFFAEWQIGVYSPSSFSWLENQKEQTGTINITEDLVFSGKEAIFGHNHGLNIGLKFQF